MLGMLAGRMACSVTFCIGFFSFLSLSVISSCLCISVILSVIILFLCFYVALMLGSDVKDSAFFSSLQV